MPSSQIGSGGGPRPVNGPIVPEGLTLSPCTARFLFGAPAPTHRPGRMRLLYRSRAKVRLWPLSHRSGNETYAPDSQTLHSAGNRFTGLRRWRSRFPRAPSRDTACIKASSLPGVNDPSGTPLVAATKSRAPSRRRSHQPAAFAASGDARQNRCFFDNRRCQTGRLRAPL